MHGIFTRGDVLGWSEQEKAGIWLELSSNSSWNYQLPLPLPSVFFFCKLLSLDTPNCSRLQCTSRTSANYTTQTTSLLTYPHRWRRDRVGFQFPHPLPRFLFCVHCNSFRYFILAATAAAAFVRSIVFPLRKVAPISFHTSWCEHRDPVARFTFSQPIQLTNAGTECPRRLCSWRNWVVRCPISFDHTTPRHSRFIRLAFHWLDEMCNRPVTVIYCDWRLRRFHNLLRIVFSRGLSSRRQEVYRERDNKNLRHRFDASA